MASASKAPEARLEALLRRLGGLKSVEEATLEAVRLRFRSVLAQRCGELQGPALRQLERRVWKFCFHGKARKSGKWLRDASRYYESLSALPAEVRLMRLGDLARYGRRIGSVEVSTAASLYRRAILARPDEGSGYNALGVLFAAEGLAVSAAYSYARAASSPSPFSAAKTNLEGLEKARDAVAELGVSVARDAPDLRALDALLRRAKLSRRVLWELAVVAIFRNQCADALRAVLRQAVPYRPAALPALVVLSDWLGEKKRGPVEALPERRLLRTFGPLAVLYASLEPLADDGGFCCTGATLDSRRRRELGLL